MKQTEKQSEAVETGSPEESHPILRKLEKALRSDGDFPVRARVVTELRFMASDPDTSIAEITEVILREPSLGTRVLHLVNSAYFRRAVPIMTVSQAVLQIGMKNLVDLCAGLVLMQKFIPAAKRGGIFADNLKKSILTSLMTSSLGAGNSENGVGERGYLAGTFYSLGYLLLAYYFPQVYEAAAKRAQARGYSIEQSVAEVLGIAREKLSLSVVEALKIPQYYHDLLSEAFGEHEGEAKGSNSPIAAALKAADKISETVVHGSSRADLDATLEEVSKECGFTMEQLERLIVDLPQSFDSHCQFIEITFFSLPDFIVDFGKEHQEPEERGEGSDEQGGDEVSYYISEIKQAIENGESLSSVITSVMETLAFGLPYDRVLLLLADEAQGSLVGRMALGTGVNIEPTSVHRCLEELNNDHDPDAAAYRVGTPQIYGDPLFEDGWPFAAVPIGAAHRAVGVIYADSVTPAEGEMAMPVDSRTEAALSLLADLLDRAVVANDY